MDVFGRLRGMRTRTYFLVFTPPSVLAFVVLFWYCLGVYGSACYTTPLI